MQRSFCSVPDAQIFDSSATEWQGWCGLTAPNQEPYARIIGPDARIKSLGNTFVNVLSEADIGFRNSARNRSNSFSGVMTHAQLAISQAILLKASQSQDGSTAIGSLSDGEEISTTLGGMQSRDPQYATTMMIRNIPQQIQQRHLAKEVDATGFRDTYDFLYLPSNIAAKQGKGYAFVNFVTPEAAQAFKTAWHARTPRFKMGNTQCGRKKLLDVSVSSLQGKAANMAQWQSSSGKTNRITNPSFRPMIKELPKSLKLM